MKAHKAYIGLGSNQEQPLEQLKQALECMQYDDSIDLLNVSSFYQSRALIMPNSPTQADYINAVAEIEYQQSAENLLDDLQNIENAQGRVRITRWGARTLDLDILLYAQTEYHSERLEIPHEQLQYRNFVVFPLMEIAPNIHIPGLGLLSDIADTLSWDGLKKIKEI